MIPKNRLIFLLSSLLAHTTYGPLLHDIIGAPRYIAKPFIPPKMGKTKGDGITRENCITTEERNGKLVMWKLKSSLLS